MNATDKAVERIKAAGFSHIKFELEGNLGRGGSSTCNECDGSGHERCNTCDGEGAIESEELVGQNYHNTWVECDECYGDGTQNCEECDGTGECGSYESERFCEDYMMEHVSQAARDALAFPHMGVRESDPETYYNSGHRHMGFYEDGSVDSEFTFTIPIEKYRFVGEWIEAFKALATVCDNGFVETEGAGMHVTLLTSGIYPSRQSLNHEGMENFRAQVTKLLPALFFLASADHNSRDLGYRSPRVSADDKYSAIYTNGDTSLEYRVFETCYNRPEAIEEYIQVIANTIKYYADPTLRAKTLGKKFYFTDGDNVARFFNNTEQLRILNAQIKELKPADKTIKKLKADRGVYHTIKSLQRGEKVVRDRLRGDYQTYRKHYEERLKTPVQAWELESVRGMMERENYTEQQAISYERGLRPLMNLRTFINDRLYGSEYGTHITV